jgi:hypothetical protein
LLFERHAWCVLESAGHEAAEAAGINCPCCVIQHAPWWLQVIGVRVVLQDGDSLFEQDPEGLGLAARINTHLPASVRVGGAGAASMGVGYDGISQENSWELY